MSTARVLEPPWRAAVAAGPGGRGGGGGDGAPGGAAGLALAGAGDVLRQCGAGGAGKTTLVLDLARRLPAAASGALC